MSTKYFALFLSDFPDRTWPALRRLHMPGWGVGLVLFGRLYVRLGRLW